MISGERDDIFSFLFRAFPNSSVTDEPETMEDSVQTTQLKCILVSRQPLNRHSCSPMSHVLHR